ncbi:U5 small nuclear ribonucleoprotein TSSC4 [Phascolarctos cinereus]|uniref:U5 small nuclear ribonucleoprotein TSSC4 n=1 Tax=Phascolarctos cinereus TaxID=38626 RepID=A0A6P5IWM2_PHACI|nr:protein TSSC4 [Phascolarctos cinereus]XP_020826548.1 protein TSSC4 [Phascolarctos cinereus]
MADRGGGDASLGLLPDCEAMPSDTGSLSDSDSDSAGLSPGEPPFLEEAADSEDEEPPQPPGSPVRPFHLRGMSPTFSLRSRSIFDGLEGVARTPAPPAAAPETPAPDAGTFKRPLPPPGPPRRPVQAQVPDYVTHPERWTKYSLEDVPEGSDRSNRAVALEFLGSLKKRVGGQSPAPQESCAPSFNQDPSSRGAGRIVFTKPAKAGEARPERKRTPWRADDREPGDELVALGHLGSAGGPDVEAEGEEPPRRQAEPQDANMQEEEAAHLEPPAGPVGFHSSRKRSRDHLRLKGTSEEESEEA